MPTAYLFEWIGVTRDQYQAMVRDMHWEEKTSPENTYLVTGSKGYVMFVLTAWEFPQAFEQFCRTKFHQALLKSGLGQPLMKSWRIPSSKGEKCNSGGTQSETQDLPAVFNFHHNWLARPTGINLISAN